MSLLRHILAVVAGLIMALTLWGYLTTASIFSAAATQTAAARSGLYTAIAKQTPHLLLRVTPLTTQQEKLLGNFIDASLIEGWSQELLPQLEHYYRQGGIRPQLNLSAITTRAQAEGIILPAVLSERLDQPITISAGRLDVQLSEIIRWSALLRLWGPIVLSVVVMLGLAINRGRRLLWLAESLVWAALFALAAWLVLHFTPQLLASAISNSTAHALAGAITAWLDQLLASAAHDMVRGAGAFVIVAVVVALGHVVMHLTVSRRKA